MMSSISNNFITELSTMLNSFNYPSIGVNKGLSKFKIKFKENKFSLYMEYSEVLNNSIMNKFIGSNELIDISMLKDYMKLMLCIPNDNLSGKNIDRCTKDLLSAFGEGNLKKIIVTEYLGNFANLQIMYAPKYSITTDIIVESSLSDWDNIKNWLDNIIMNNK